MTSRRATSRARLALLTTTALLAVGLTWVSAAPAQAVTQNLALWAMTGSTTMPGGQAVTVWGYSTGNTPVTRPGGPTLTVGVGDQVQITLHNQVGEPTGLLVQGQTMVPDLSGVAAGNQATYSFTANRPGTFLYEAAPLPNAQHQPAMGLYGALVVLPADAGRAYPDASTAYDDDEVLLLGEIDPALSNAASPAAFDMRKYAPKYFVVNGRAYPDTAPIPAAAGSTELLRYVNAGMRYHSMGTLGAGQTVIALDGAPLDDARHYVAETIGPGQTADALVDVPAAPTVDTDLTVYDASMSLHNSNTGGVGGMLTAIHVPGAAAPGDTTGPVVRSALVNAGALTATVDDGAGHGGSTIQAAEFYLDDVTGAGAAMSAVDAAFDAAQEPVTASVTVPAGEHVVYVRGRDAAGSWGPFTSVLISGADVGGPTTREPLLTPNRVNGANTQAVAVSATADETTSGNSVIAAAEYFLDTVGADASGNAMVVSPAASVASIDATIPPSTLDGLMEGSHVIFIHAQDGQGNWGEVVTVNLIVDEHGPTTSGVSAAPTPNNGTLRYNSSTPAVRVIATTMTDPISGAVNSPISSAEAFIDTVGANGSGLRLTASDGVFNDTTEGGYTDVPLSTVVALANGSHTISVHARDAVGNWGPFTTTTLVIDKTRPTLTGVTATPNPTQGAASVTLTANASDTSAVTRAEWWRGTDPGVGNGTPMTITGSGPWSVSATLDVRNFGDGSYPLRVRVRDAAGNWSTVVSTTLAVRGPLFLSTFGNSNPPGVAGTADDADVYGWDGSSYVRSVDLSAAPYNVPLAANVDGLSRVDATHFYLSFSNDTTLPVVGTVQDEDVVFWNAGTWSLYFNGTTHGLNQAGQDVDAVTVSGGVLYFSTGLSTNPTGVAGTGDDADIYSWNGTVLARVWDASANGVPATANVDGFDRVDATHFYLSFSATTTTVPQIGTVQDEDVVFVNAGTWSVYFDGTGHGLTTDNLDVDAFDVP